MGDADSEIVVPVQEIESWMDEALEVAEALDHLFLHYMINVNYRTKQIMVQLKNLECFRQLFVAMNLLIIPVVISILICYSTRNTIDSSGLEEGFQLAVTFLMFLSGSIGLPIYFYSLWESYSCAKNLNKEIGSMRQSVPRIENGRLDRNFLSEDSFLTFFSGEASADRMNEFSRMLSDRMPEAMRAIIERRLNTQFAEPSEEDEDLQMLSLRRNFSSETPPITTEINASPPSDLKDCNKDVAINGHNTANLSEVDNPDLYEFQMCIDVKSPDLITNAEQEGSKISESKNIEADMQSSLGGIDASKLENDLENTLLVSRGDIFTCEDFY